MEWVCFSIFSIQITPMYYSCNWRKKTLFRGGGLDMAFCSLRRWRRHSPVHWMRRFCAEMQTKMWYVSYYIYIISLYPPSCLPSNLNLSPRFLNWLPGALIRLTVAKHWIQEAQKRLLEGSNCLSDTKIDFQRSKMIPKSPKSILKTQNHLL